MKQFIYPFFFLLLFSYHHSAQAQGENNVWCFGANIGLDFNNNPPTFFQHNMMAYEGCASVSDAGGHLLFYTLGSRMWDRNGDLMPGCTNLLGNGPFLNGMPLGSAISGAAIIKSPNNDGKYFVFCLNAREEGLDNLYYSVVDMNLNGGLGDIVPGQGSILLGPGYSEVMAAFKGGDCHSYWLVTRNKTAPQQYHAYKVDINGVHTTPVISTGISTSSTIQGPIFYAPDGVTSVMSADQGIEVATFNGITGVFGNFMILNNVNAAYFLAFSPDQTKLYLSGNSVFQYDFSLMPNVTAVNNSGIKIADTLYYNGMRAGPDGKIYLQRRGGPSFGALLPPILSVINNPNLAGTACNLDTTFMELPALTWLPVFSGYGIEVPINPPGNLSTTRQESKACFQNSVTLTANNNTGGNTYQWNNGTSGPSTTVSQSGLYYVSYTIGCDLYVDSFAVTITDFNLSLGNDTTICSATPLLLDPHISGTSYLWQDGSVNPTYTVTTTGTYYVTVTQNGCSRSDTIHVQSENPISLQITEQDTLICNGSQLTLHAAAVPSGNLTWNTGAAGNTITVDHAGTYTATTANTCGTAQDNVTVGIIDFGLWLGNDTIICANAPMTLDASVPGASYTWQDGSTTSTYTVTQPGTYYVTVTVQHCSKTDTVTFNAAPLPEVSIAEQDTTICSGSSTLLHAGYSGNGSLTWSTGATADTLLVYEPGVYTVSNTTTCGSAQASITVSVKECLCHLFVPSGFTPNNDALNDVIHARFDCPYIAYSFSVYNRYGNEIFRSKDPATGWNGTFKGKTCDVGVYFYMVSVVDLRGNQFFKKGDITLMR